MLWEIAHGREIEKEEKGERKSVCVCLANKSSRIYLEKNWASFYINDHITEDLT